MMADIQNHQLNSENIRELLSPYLDGEVTEEERGLVEQVLAASPELQRELEMLRRTVALLTALPPVPAPRPFTLTEADVTIGSPVPKTLFGLPGWFRGLATLTAMLLCAVVAGSFFWGMSFNQAGQPMAEVAKAPAATAVAPAPQSAIAPAQPIDKEEAASAGAVAREAPTTAAAMQAEVTPTALPATAESAKQAAPSAAGPAPAAESQAGMAAQVDQSDTTQQPLALEVAATPSPEATVLMMMAPAQEPAQQQAIELAETEQTAAASVATPPQLSPTEKVAADTAQLSTELTPTPPESPALKPSDPSPPPPSALPPQPGTTAMPTPATGAANVTSAPSTNFWSVAGIVVVGLLVIAGVVIWLVKRGRPQAP